MDAFLFWAIVGWPLWFGGSLLLIPVLVAVSQKIHSDFFTDQGRKKQAELAVGSTKSRATFAFQSALGTWVLCLSNWLFLLQGALSFTEVISCRAHFLLGTPVYQTARFIMYLIFISRLDAIYKGTSFQYSPRLLRSLAVFMTVIHFANVFYGMAFTHGFKRIRKSVMVVRCVYEFAPGGPFLLVLEDLIINVSCLWLFTKPLKKLAQAGGDRAFQRLAAKVTILTWSCAVSTLCFYIFAGLIGNVTFSSVDVFTNTISVVLMTNWFSKRTFELSCFCPIWCAVNICRCVSQDEFDGLFDWDNEASHQMGVRSATDLDLVSSKSGSSTPKIGRQKTFTDTEI